MPTAIVTGATGITGTAIVNALVNAPEYTEIYTLSRSQKSPEHPKVKHATLDLQSSADEMCKSLSHIPPVTHIYFCAYLANPDEGEASRINGAMLSNFLEALTKSGQTIELKHFCLTCGLKQYGVHQGQPKNPIYEDDDDSLVWLEQGDRPPNFYYTQQRILEKHAADHHNKWAWVVTYPQDVIGFAKANFMNLTTSLGLYCAISKELEGSKLIFPGNKTNYLSFNNWTSARVHAEFCLWAGKTPNANNQRFNVSNGDAQSWQDMWPRLAARYGCNIPEKMFPAGDERKAYPGYEMSYTKLHDRPPIAEVAAKIGLKDEFKPSEIFCQINLQEWAKRPEVVKAWETLRDRYGLDQGSWDGATWDFSTFVLGRNYSLIGSMSKARKLGWTGYADTWDEFQRTFKELEDAKMLPPAANL
ncbi:NAD(P)-binding protein [Hypoxylon trugodes]|uniref:NAD(P)-binding protein n=1 Tax=Hypoxylon trugodes TaxID=326681 RepID=UPI00218DA993|nr:NAD(P)-binding protein [Hypoxylon trugodes]KAI1387587.1 NAD(P)-binding protein [Hypoxylon trugodes]